MDLGSIIAKILPPGVAQQMLQGVENMSANFEAIKNRLTAIEAQNATLIEQNREILACISTKADQRAA